MTLLNLVLSWIQRFWYCHYYQSFTVYSQFKIATKETGSKSKYGYCGAMFSFRSSMSKLQSALQYKEGRINNWSSAYFSLLQTEADCHNKLTIARTVPSCFGDSFDDDSDTTEQIKLLRRWWLKRLFSKWRLFWYCIHGWYRCVWAHAYMFG